MGKHNRKPKIMGKNVSYREKQPLFSDKEIIFRSRGRAKVFNISSKMQVVFLACVLMIASWSAYSYHVYNKTGDIISDTNKELSQTRDAYVDLMSDFIAIHKNIGAMINSLDEKKINDNDEIDTYKQQALIVEDKIKQITDEKEWIDTDEVNEKTSAGEAILQRDIAISERNALRAQVASLEQTIDELKTIETELLDRVNEVAEKEISKIKSSISTVNSALRKKGQYYNALANKKTDSRGGLYVPDKAVLADDANLSEAVGKVYDLYSDLEYYRQVVDALPIGKPVWSFWVSSEFGRRSDPLNKKAAVHKGVDLASRKGNKVSSMAAGKVVRAEYVRGYGNMVEVDHGNGFVTKYAHLNKIYVKKGAKVEKNEAVGEVGSTGRSTGPHLHYEVLYRNVNVDPMVFIKAKI